MAAKLIDCKAANGIARLLPNSGYENILIYLLLIFTKWIYTATFGISKFLRLTFQLKVWIHSCRGDPHYYCIQGLQFPACEFFWRCYRTAVFDCSGLYYIEYTLQNPGESRRHLFSVLGIANNGWYNRLYTLTGQVGFVKQIMIQTLFSCGKSSFYKIFACDFLNLVATNENEILS